jgi:hypothetical protein
MAGGCKPWTSILQPEKRVLEMKMSKEQSAELSKKVRDRVSAYFTPEQLVSIDEFIQLGGQGAAFDQIHQAERAALADEFRRLSLEPKGNSRGWKFNRDEIHERR